jgi:hypothetical protein
MGSQNYGRFNKWAVKICGRGRSTRSSSHTDSRVNRSIGNSYHAKTSFRLVNKIQISWLHFLFPKVKSALKGKRSQDVEGIKENLTAEVNAVPLEAFVDSFLKLFKLCNNLFKYSEINFNRNKTVFISFYFCLFFHASPGTLFPDRVCRRRRVLNTDVEVNWYVRQFSPRELPINNTYCLVSIWKNPICNCTGGQRSFRSYGHPVACWSFTLTFIQEELLLPNCRDNSKDIGEAVQRCLTHFSISSKRIILTLL